MELSTITPELLKRTLRAWRQAEPIPSDWLESCLLVEAGVSAPIEQQLWLQNYVSSQVHKALDRYRHNERASAPSKSPETREAILTRLADDFSQNDVTLEAWSALYYRFLTPFDLTIKEINTAVPLVGRSFNRRVNAGLKFLTETLRQAEYAAHTRLHTLQLHHHLPTREYAHLFGVEKHLKKLANWLSAPEGPSLVSIEGIGGIGKTALAQLTAHHLSQEMTLTDICWISARQEWVNEAGELKQIDDSAQTLDDVIARLATQLGQERLAGLDTADKLTGLKPLLFSSPHLIVIDNLETLANSQALLPAIAPLAGHTRFLLTSRQTLRYHSQVHVFTVPPLSQADSQSLVESELVRNGRTIQLSPTEMAELYKVTGGLPLALKLSAAQMAQRSLSAVLAGLREAAPEGPAQMYRYIYGWAWNELDDSSRALLLSMLRISPEGEDSEWLQLISGLSDTVFHAALRELCDYSLVEIGGSLTRPIYNLHRLTVTFLQTDIISPSNSQSNIT